MKLAISFGIGVAILAWGSMVSAQTNQTTDSSFRQEVPSVPIDGIDIPISVLTYAQMEHQGYAVTKAQKLQHNNKEAIRLLVDRDDMSTGYDGKHLFFDATWKLLDDKDLEAPGPVITPTPVLEKPAETEPEKPGEEEPVIKKPEEREAIVEESPTPPEPVKPVEPEEPTDSDQPTAAQ